MRKYILNITGKQSIAFMGEEIAKASNRDTSEETTTEWDLLRIFKVDPEWSAEQEAKNGTKIPPYNIGIQKGTIWQGGKSRFKVFYADSVRQVVDIVRARLPMFHREIEEQLRLNNSPPETLHEPSRSHVVS